MEQFLLMFVGIADTFVVSFSSEADASGVSLVTSFNTVLIFLFTALSSGGAVIISQYLGGKNYRAASRSSGQLLMISAVISAVMAALILLFRTLLLRLLFGRIEADVMAACQSYLWITTLSLPFLAIYDAGAALCRSIGRTNVTMDISLAANIVNVIGNCVGVFVLKLGAAGVAWPSLISRLLSAAAVTAYCFRTQGPVRYTLRDVFAWDGGLLKKIMGIALPNGVENGVHQLVKVALSSMVALVRHVSDRGQRRGPEHLGAGGQRRGPEHLGAGVHHGPCHGPGLHHGHWPMHGRAGRGRGQPLFQKAQ